MLPLAIAPFFVPPHFDVFREHVAKLKFRDVINPVDGVTYPLICTDIPTLISNEVKVKLGEFWPGGINVHTMFLRLSPEGAPVPHQAHTDSTMGQYSLMVYLNQRRHAKGGTSLLRHRENGMVRDPLDEEQTKLWLRDMNTPEQWEVVGMCPMAPNRGFIFPANRFHRAEPVGGFGKTARDARLVLTAFFSEA